MGRAIDRPLTKNSPGFFVSKTVIKTILLFLNMKTYVKVQMWTKNCTVGSTKLVMPAQGELVIS